MQDGALKDYAMTDAAPFIFYPDPRLSEPAKNRPVDAGLLAIGARLLAAAEKAQAYGLAAHHIGQVAPVVVISVSDPSTRDYRVLYNPMVLSTDGPSEAGPEGSVSMPGIEVDVVRPAHAQIGFDDAGGQGQELALSGFAARVAQHEIDQANGVFFLGKISRLKRDAAIRRFAKLGRR
jgi:peptide deformylase